MAHRFALVDKIAIIKSYYDVKNAEEVRRRWASVSTAPKPGAQTIRDLVQKFELTGSVLDVKQSGRPKNVRTDELKEAIAASLDRSPQKSTRRLSVELGASQMSVLRALHEMKYRPFRPRLVHGLLEDDPFQRIEFCEQFLTMVENEETMLDRIIWSDEAMFKLNGHVNRHNCVYWDSDNPHIIMEKEVNAPGVMVWAGIWSEGIIGPFFRG
jgi:transposase